MAEDNEQKDTVSREAFDRVKNVAATEKADRVAAQAVAAQALLVDAAYEHLKGKVPEPYMAAKALARDSRFADLKPDDRAAKFDEWLAERKAIFGDPTPATNPASTEPGTETPPAEPAAPIAPPPGAARPAPSPANPGGAPTLEPLTFMSKEVQDLVKSNNREGIQKLIKEGRYQPHPDNPIVARTS